MAIGERVKGTAIARVARGGAPDLQRLSYMRRQEVMVAEVPVGGFDRGPRLQVLKELVVRDTVLAAHLEEFGRRHARQDVGDTLDFAIGDAQAVFAESLPFLEASFEGDSFRMLGLLDPMKVRLHGPYVLSQAMTMSALFGQHGLGVWRWRWWRGSLRCRGRLTLFIFFSSVRLRHGRRRYISSSPFTPRALMGSCPSCTRRSGSHQMARHRIGGGEEEVNLGHAWRVSPLGIGHLGLQALQLVSQSLEARIERAHLPCLVLLVLLVPGGVAGLVLIALARVAEGLQRLHIFARESRSCQQQKDESNDILTRRSIGAWADEHDRVELRRPATGGDRSEEHTSELQSQSNL